MTRSKTEAPAGAPATQPKAPAQTPAQAPAKAAPKRAPARRPRWLPQEFARPEDLVRAYETMRADVGREPAHEPKATPPAETEPEIGAPPTAPVYPGDLVAPAPPAAAGPAPAHAPTPASEPSSAADFSPFEKELCETGGLCAESYAQLEALGAPRWLVDRHIEGRIAVAEAARREIVELAGGEERFDAMRRWARETLPEAELAAYENAVKGPKEAAKLAVLGLAAAYVKEVGDTPTLVGGAGAPVGSGPFANPDELAQAIRDPRYRSDPEYRAEVADRIAQRRVF